MARLTTKPRNFLCETCKKTYISKGGLFRHRKTHLTGEARDKEMHHCLRNGCNFKSLQRSNLAVHVNVIHLRLQNLVCHECPYRTGDPANMTRHKIRKHGQSSTDKRRSRIKDEIRPVDLMSPSPPSPTVPQFSPPPSPSPSIDDEMAQELRHDVLATSPSSLPRYSLPPKPFLCPPLPSILDRLNTPARYPNESCSSSGSLPSLASLVLPRPPLPDSVAPPLVPSQPHSNALDPTAYHNHLRRGSVSCIPACSTESLAIRTTKDDRRRSEPCLGSLPLHHPSRSPSPVRPGPRSLPTLPGTATPASSSSGESSTIPSFDPSPLFQP
ncbi:hypothetical protein EDD18DRAFT_677258 [Armillaria luteobubalina]|uniref:C2H2-type domain-containing protein n=1 Tax=Armillaria luteobubalina TaxID=153913 RepID=A0AA39QGD0_9AGAR|nr:hypothetical protein EDD18DRAFT_677258 [Armillaria luteobubalina]